MLLSVYMSFELEIKEELKCGTKTSGRESKDNHGDSEVILREAIDRIMEKTL